MPTIRASLLLALLLAFAPVLAGCGAGSIADMVDPPDSPAPPDDLPTTPPPQGGTSMSAAELALAGQVLALVNRERQSQGLGALAWSDAGSQVAWHHSLDMDQRDYFDHVNPDGMLPWDRLSAAGITWSAAGENIAWGYGSAEAVMNAWMNSSGHRANILNGNFTHIGVGVHQTSENIWWTQVFYRP